jgi:hypothetical protein
MPKDCRIIGNK